MDLLDAPWKETDELPENDIEGPITCDGPAVPPHLDPVLPRPSNLNRSRHGCPSRHSGASAPDCAKKCEENWSG